MVSKEIAYIGLTTICFGVFPHHSIQAIPPVVSEGCNPVGRVLPIANSQLPTGQPLCPEDMIAIRANKKLRFACYSSNRAITLKPGLTKIGNHCKGVSHRYRRCTNQITSDCIIGRNPTTTTRATLFVPYSTTIIEGQPSFLWEAHPSADQYSVELFLGKKMLWKQTVTSNSMPYPSSRQPLEPGKAYLLKVSAFRGGQMLNTNISVLNRVSALKLSKLNVTFRAIDELNISTTEKVLDKEKIYLSQGLLSESIKLLKKQLTRDPYHPRLHRLLGDRFMNAGLPNLAQPYFLEAKALADQKRDMWELAKANEGLAEIAALPAAKHPPVRTKPNSPPI